MNIDDAQVVLHLECEPRDPEALKEFCRRAFPVYESLGGCCMALYESRERPGCFDEVGYYQSEADYLRAEKALEQDPQQVALIREWKALLKTAPKVRVVTRSEKCLTKPSC
jgi:hypothetical protein